MGVIRRGCFFARQRDWNGIKGRIVGYFPRFQHNGWGVLGRGATEREVSSAALSRRGWFSWQIALDCPGFQNHSLVCRCSI